MALPKAMLQVSLSIVSIYNGMSVSTTVYFGTKYAPMKAVVEGIFQDLNVIKDFPLKGRVHTDSTNWIRSPSVSCVIGVSLEQEALLKWQGDMIRKMGLAGFRKYCQERTLSGRSMHKTISDVLQECSKNENYWEETSVDEILEKTNTDAHGYVRSVLPFLRSLKWDSKVLTEQMTKHTELRYQGRFDAVINYKGVACMIDWKTASIGSSSEKTAKKEFSTDSSRLQSLYSYPTQIAAYAGSFNADKNYERFEKITTGAVIMAHEDGSECTVVEMKEIDVQEHWTRFLLSLHSFWNMVNNAQSKEKKIVDSIYKGTMKNN